jgi:hypothetical protein
MEINVNVATDAAMNFEYCEKENVESVTRHGNGHINDTFLVKLKEGTHKKLILQRINHEIFKDPEGLMENILKVTEHLRKKARDPYRETLTVVKTRDNKPFYKDPQGNYWRMYLYIENAICLEKVETPEEFYESAVSFGKFQSMLSDFPAETLRETIPDFHNTVKRYEDFERAVKEDRMGRASLVEKEIFFLRERKEEMARGQKMLESGELPLRVTHNDTKLNNIMMDSVTGKGICVIDLDTVMPGLSIYDFGDSIRFGANTAAEDETDLSKVSLDLDLFELYVKGYIEGADGRLTDAEICSLPYGAKNMTMECGMRFLTDYLNGDTYFKIHRENHNLDRARDQFKLVCDMENKWSQMENIVNDRRK